MKSNRIELKWSQFGVKAITMDFKIIPHVNVTYRPKEIRQVTHILRRVLNFSVKRKINSAHSYIQLSVTSTKALPNKTRSWRPSCAQLPLAGPAGAGARRRSGSTPITYSHLFPFLFSQSLSQTDFCSFFFSSFLYWFVLQLRSVLPLVVLILCSSLWFRCLPAIYLLKHSRLPS